VKATAIVKPSFLAQLGISLAMIVLTLRPAFSQDTLPDGWRKPTLAEANGDWRKDNATKFLVVKGDFDGDGQVDLAELLVGDSGSRMGLFVRLSSRNGRWEPISESVHEFDKPLGAFGIRIVHPEKYETLCGSDPSVCAPDTPKVFDLGHSAIEFFSHGRASSFFYWDQTAQRFRSLPIGD
jgi:hypothetical protein